jgi:hypothetical protein
VVSCFASSALLLAVLLVLCRRRRSALHKAGLAKLARPLVPGRGLPWRDTNRGAGGTPGLVEPGKEELEHTRLVLKVEEEENAGCRRTGGAGASVLATDEAAPMRPASLQQVSARRAFATGPSAALRKADANALIGQRLCVFDSGHPQGRIGTVMGVQRAFGSSTKHVVVFEDGDGAPQTVLLQKTTEDTARGCKFHVLPPDGDIGEVLRAVDKAQADIRSDVSQVQRALARVELTMQVVLETSRATGRLVAALALGELDCPKYVYVVPDTPPGGWEKGVFWFHSLHATQLRLVLVCAHDFQAVRCGPNGNGYPVKVEKGWVKKFFHTFGPVIKIGLFAARVTVLASGVGAFRLPFLPHAHLGHDAAEHALGEALEEQSQHMHQLHLIDEMLEKFGELAEEGAEAAETHEELDHVIKSAVDADRPARPASELLQAWTANSYRSLQTLLRERDPQLLQTGLVHAVAGGASEWVAPENVGAWTQQQQGDAHRSNDQ